MLLYELEKLAARHIGFFVPENGHDRFARILHERAKQLGYSSLQDYMVFLQSGHHSKEWEELARLLTTGETFFFRDHGQFDLMRLHLLPELIARHRGDKTLRLWSAGCSSGEEVYSLAMLVDMVMPDRTGWDILILGTDIDSKAIAKAQCGRYGSWSFRMVPEEIQQRYFTSAEYGVRNAELKKANQHSIFRTPQSEELLLNENIRKMITFRVSNLLRDPFPDPTTELYDMDLILCRNVFIYFDSAAVFTIAGKFAATLREGGYLLTAHTELMSHHLKELDSRLFAEGVVYQKSATSVPDIRSVQIRENSCPYPPQPIPQSALPTPQSNAPHPNIPQSEIRNLQSVDVLLKEARAQADKGEFDQAECSCRKALINYPLAAPVYFLLAQLAQIKGEFDQAKDFLNKAIYLDHRFVAAYLELATLCERSGDITRSHALRHSALGIVRSLPKDQRIDQYETTAGDLTQWLTQWESEPGSKKKH